MPTNASLEERIRLSPNITKSPFYRFAEELTVRINQRFPLGAINRYDVWTALPEAVRVPYLDALEQYSNMTIAIARGKGNLTAFLHFIAEVRYGSCELIASYAEGYMRLHYPQTPSEVMYLEEHAILIVGRLPKSNPENPHTWGKDAIIYDFWAELYYLAKDFETVRSQVPHIPSVLKVMDAQTKHYKEFIPSERHYLSGNPRVAVGELSASYDILYKSWVSAEETNKRLATAPSISLFHQPFPAQLLEKYQLDDANSTSLEIGLRLAAAAGNATELAIFIKYVSNLNATDSKADSQQTAFHCAAIKGHLPCCQLLKKAGANNEIPDAAGKTAKQYLEAFLRERTTTQVQVSSAETQQGTTFSA